uniref:Uncharacterized protein n=1 Tax=Pristionchus pacificus TaxID=54126 RepID=A0A2A6CA95_PRIPA|eukprot:PDM75016.1 hypothetical protein PRIPAC_40397 [Pristionchus pacificus]
MFDVSPSSLILSITSRERSIDGLGMFYGEKTSTRVTQWVPPPLCELTRQPGRPPTRWRDSIEEYARLPFTTVGRSTSKSRKTVFDVTSSGANGRSTCKMNMHIVIRTLENPKTQSFSDLTFFELCQLLSDSLANGLFCNFHL